MNNIQLSLREEGHFWNAYIKIGLKSLLIGSIVRSVVDDPAMKQRFMDLMKSAMERMMADVGAPVATWGAPQVAPETERGGNA